MNIELLLPLLVTTIVAIFGWIAAHRFNSRRDFLNKRRELRIQYLIEAYRRLEAASNASNPQERQADIESALADIQLLGTLKQIQLAVKFMDEFSKRGTASLDELLSSLRKNLRLELSLEETSLSVKYLRFENNTEK
jgi:hypothetical protein